MFMKGLVKASPAVIFLNARSPQQRQSKAKTWFLPIVWGKQKSWLRRVLWLESPTPCLQILSYWKIWGRHSARADNEAEAKQQAEEEMKPEKFRQAPPQSSEIEEQSETEPLLDADKQPATTRCLAVIFAFLPVQPYTQADRVGAIPTHLLVRLLHHKMTISL